MWKDATLLYDIKRTKGVINCIIEWISRYPTDFDFKMIALVHLFLRHWKKSFASSDQDLFKLIKTIEERTFIAKSLFISRMNFAKKTSPQLEPSKKYKLIDYDPKLIAQCMTELDCEMISHVTVIHLLLTIQRSFDIKKDPCLIKYIHGHNAICFFIPAFIFASEKMDEIAQKIDFLLRLLKELKALNNLSSFSCIHAGLASSPVYRIRATQTFKQNIGFSDKKFETFDEGMFHQLLFNIYS